MSDNPGRVSWTTRTTWEIITSVTLFAALPVALASAQAGSQDAVKQAVNETGIDRGVCCMLGFDKDVALDLVRSTSFLIHILDPSPDTVATVQQVADQSGIGIDRVVVQPRVAGGLPYADNLIDLLVATQITDQELADLDVEEILRVLRPAGAAVVGRIPDGTASGDFLAMLQTKTKMNGIKPLAADFVLLRKRVPDGIDTWSHWEHGPDNNPVSTDQVIKAPYLTQFLAEPYYITMPSVTTVAGGRTFLATGHIAHHRREWDIVNQLIARNGYNGTILWQRQLPNGFLAHRSAFIATEDVFYLLDGDGCLLLDAATGKEKGRIQIPEVPGDWKWMALDDGVLYVMAGPKGGKAEVVRGDRNFGGWSWEDLSPGYYTPRVPWGLGNTVAAFTLAENRLLWKHEEETLIDSRGMAMLGDKIFLYCPDKHLGCLQRSTGEVCWTNADRKVLDLIEQPGRGLVSTPGFKSACLAVATPEALIIQGQTRMNVVAISTRDGSFLWSKKKFTNNPNAIFVDGKVVLGVGTRGRHAVIEPVTGDVLEELPFGKAACTRLTGCPDSFFVRGEGTLRFDRDTKRVLIDGAVRPACQDGAIAANGLLYLGPWTCDCNLSLIGAMARCSAGDFRFDQIDDSLPRLQLGDGDIQSVVPLEITAQDWPTYRANNARTASTVTRLANPNATPAAARVPTWAYIPDRPCVPTPPATAAGLVFVAGSDGKVRAFDAQTGQLRWQRATAGPIKATPTIWAGRVYVGSGDGYVYALEAATGRLLWRFRAAPQQRLIMVYGHLCSTWPVNTGVLVHDGVAYFAAGIIDSDGTYVYALDAKTGVLRWQNNSSGHLSAELRKGVSALGNLTVHDGRLLMAGGNQVSPAAFDLATGRCLNTPFAQGQPKANHGRFIGLFLDEYPVVGGRILYASPQNVANKDSFVLFRNDRPLNLNFGGVPPAWNEDIIALSDFRNGKLRCCETSKTRQRIERGFAPPSDRPNGRPQPWSSLAQSFKSDGAVRWLTDLDNPDQFEVEALAVTPDRVAAVVRFQRFGRAHPQWQVIALNSADGTPIWFWRHNLPFEPLPEGLAVGRAGQLVVVGLGGQVVSLAPQQPPRKVVRN